MSALDPIASRHDNLLDLISDVPKEDPFAALRLLQICEVNRFWHILGVVPQELSADFCVPRDVAITATFGAIQGLLVDPATTTHHLHVVAGGAGLTSLNRIVVASYLGAFFQMVGPLLGRLAEMEGTTPAMLEQPHYLRTRTQHPVPRIGPSVSPQHIMRQGGYKPPLPPPSSSPSGSLRLEATSSKQQGTPGRWRRTYPQHWWLTSPRHSWRRLRRLKGFAM